MRRALVALTLLCTAACGGSPMAPSSGAPPATGSLESGSYLLTVSMATSGASGFSTCVSLTIIGDGIVPPLVGIFAPAPVHVERNGSSVTITPDDPAATFRMQLQLAGGTLSGTASGQYRSGTMPIAVSGRSSDTGAVVAGIVGTASVTGALDGTVSDGTMSCSNNGHGWLLTPR